MFRSFRTTREKRTVWVVQQESPKKEMSFINKHHALRFERILNNPSEEKYNETLETFNALSEDYKVYYRGKSDMRFETR